MSIDQKRMGDETYNVENIDSSLEQPSVLRKAAKGVFKIATGLIFLFIMLVIGMMIMKSLSINKLQSVTQSLDAVNNWLQFIRWTFIAGLIYWWEPLNTWLSKRNDWNTNQLKLVLNMRWFVLGMLIFIELIFIQRIHEWFMG